MTLGCHDPRPVSWIVYGAPKGRIGEDVDAFLKDQGWVSIQILTRKRSSKKKSAVLIWIVKALRPQNVVQDTSYMYADVTSCVTVALEGSRRKPSSAVSERVPGPKKVWNSSVTNRAEDVEATLPDSDEETCVAPALPALKATTCKTRTERDSGRQRLRSPKDRHRPEREESDPDELLFKQCPGWRFVDSGGSGDCGFRVIARGIAESQGKVLTAAQFASEAAKLRLLAVGHLSKHSKSFEPFWATDPEELPEHRANREPAQCFKNYTRKASCREFWFDGMLAEALSARLGTPLVIWTFNETSHHWQRSVTAPWFEGGRAQRALKAPAAVSLVLRSGHYRTLCPPEQGIECPEPWMCETERRPRSFFRGAGLRLPSQTPPREGPANAIWCSKGPSCKASEGLGCRSSCRNSKASGLKLPSCAPKRHKMNSCELLSVASMTPARCKTHHATCTLAPAHSEVGTEALSEADPDRAVHKQKAPISRIWTCSLCLCRFESKEPGRS